MHSGETVLGRERNDVDGVRAEQAGSAPGPHCRQNSVGMEKKEQAEVTCAGTK